MELRSGKKINIEIYCKKNNPNLKPIVLPIKVHINFDEASREWRKNKIHLGNGVFEYKD